MFKFIKNAVEYNNLAKSLNGMNVMLDELAPRIQRSYSYDEFTEDIVTLAYIARKGVLDRMEEFNWPMHGKIFVPTIDRGGITLFYAFAQTIGRLQMIASEIHMQEVVEEILEKGEAYGQLERILPENISKLI